MSSPPYSPLLCMARKLFEKTLFATWLNAFSFQGRTKSIRKDWTEQVRRSSSPSRKLCISSSEIGGLCSMSSVGVSALHNRNRCFLTHA